MSLSEIWGAKEQELDSPLDEDLKQLQESAERELLKKSMRHGFLAMRYIHERIIGINEMCVTLGIECFDSRQIMDFFILNRTHYVAVCNLDVDWWRNCASPTRDYLIKIARAAIDMGDDLEAVRRITKDENVWSDKTNEAE